MKLSKSLSKALETGTDITSWIKSSSLLPIVLPSLSPKINGIS